MKSLLATLTLTALGLAHIAAGGGQLIASSASNILSSLEPHQTVTISPPSLPAWHASGKSQTAAVFNATAVAEAAPAPTPSTPSTSSGQATTPPAPSTASGEGGSTLTTKYVTHAELASAIEQAIGTLPAATSPSVQAQLDALQREVSLTNNINSLAPTNNVALTISSPTVSNPSITGGSIANTSISG
ncbi:MAG: hypothetical protein ABSE76_03920, partial [Minisyncoccia bacterium]